MSDNVSIIIASIIASAFFSGMEIAFISANRMQLELERKNNTLSSKIMLYLADRPQKFIATMLLGNNIALVVYGIFMGDLLMEYLPHFQSPVTSLLVQTLISTLIILVTAEFLPKVIFSVYPNKLFKLFSFPAFIIYQVFSFFSSFVIWISNLFLRIFGKDEDVEDEPFFKDELKYFLSEQIIEAEDEEIDSEVQIFHNALDFSEIKARECMIPRKEIVAMNIQSSIEEVREKFIETGLSKIIIYQENIDNVVGYIHSFDLFKRPKNIRATLLPVEFVNEAESAKEVMNQLIKRRKSVAIVLDEYGGTSGLLTVEDVVEELFGEIEDEHDNSQLIEEKVAHDEYLFSARLEIDYLNETYNLELPESDSYETLGGLAISKLEEIPKENAEFEIENYAFVIEKVSNSRIEEIRVFTKEE